jgi:hypothetical protein
MAHGRFSFFQTLDSKQFLVLNEILRTSLPEILSASQPSCAES